MATGSLLMAAVSTPVSLPTFVGSALLAAALVASLRGWVVGTYVSDDGVVIETVLRRIAVPWNEVRAVVARTAPCPFLGTPLRTAAARLFVETVDGHRIPTHVYATSPDLWLRPVAFDMAQLRLARWIPPQP
jgi:hypothetical protein